MSAAEVAPAERGGGASLRHLLGRLAVVEARVAAAVALRRAGDPAPDDPFRGLYLSEEHVDRLLEPASPLATDPTAEALLASVEAAADEASATGAELRLRRLEVDFALQPLDIDLLLVAMAPEVDSRLEKLYGYLNDDVTRRRASVGLALQLCGAPEVSAAARARLTEGAPLLEGGLVSVEDLDRPLLSRALRPSDRAVAHLLGDDGLDPALVGVLATVGPLETAPAQEVDAMARGLAAGARLVYLATAAGSGGRELATAALLRGGGAPPVQVDLGRISPAEDAIGLAAVAGREARLRGVGLVAGPLEAVAERGDGVVRAWAELDCTVAVLGRSGWNPTWSSTVPLIVEAAPLEAAARELVWRHSLNGASPDRQALDDATRAFRLGPAQVAAAARSAHLTAASLDAEVAPAHLRAGARAQNAAGLERLSLRIEPTVGWVDLVLPDATAGALRELAARARQRERVIDEWGMRPGGGRGRGIAALFAGDSGTGKTMAAEVIAYELGLDVYSVNLATVVDKYVGETEKNLERIFTEADGVNGVLLFDEADALFGKRSEVKDAHDRYANVEVAYLLQRMERFDGLALLSTNLRANLDEAFTRRLDAVIEFPMPDAEQRRVLWDRCLSPSVPRADDIDLEFCAEAFELSGGNIRSIALTAAYLAAESGRPVGMHDLIWATEREYRKLGRLLLQSEFGHYHHLLTR